MTPIVLLVGQGKSGKDTAGAAIASRFGGVCIALADPIKRALADRRMFALHEEQLWGDQKEQQITMSPAGFGPFVTDCEFALSTALGDWKTPNQLSVFPFARWLASLPKGTTTPRHLMQTFGTECIRSVAPNFWIDYGLWVASRLLGGRHAYTPQGGIFSLPQNYDNVVCITDGRFRNEVLPVKQMDGVVLEVWRPTGVQAGFSEAAKVHASETESGTIPRWWFTGRIENDRTLEDFQSQAVSLAGALLGA